MLRLMDSENVDSGGDQIPASWSGDTLWGQTDNMFNANDNRYILHYIVGQCIEEVEEEEEYETKVETLFNRISLYVTEW